MSATLTTDDGVQHRVDGRAAKMLMAVAEQRAVINGADESLEVRFECRGNSVMVFARSFVTKLKEML